MLLLVLGVGTLTMMLIRKMLGWDYSMTLEEGIRRTYEWIEEQIKNA